MIHYNKIVVISSLLSLLLLSGCANMVTKGEKYPLMYDAPPTSILILPPINESTAADAKEYYATTLQEILSKWGYYVLPYEITADLLKMEGLYDTELVRGINLQKFKEYFGADAALYTTIKKWDLTYMVLAASLTVSVDQELVSTGTGHTLWSYNGEVVVDLSGDQGGGGGLAGLLVQALVTAINSVEADYVRYAKQANVIALSSLPFGKYHPEYLHDQSRQFVDKKSERPL